MSSYEFVLVETSSFPEIATYSFQLEKLFMEHKAHLKIGGFHRTSCLNFTFGGRCFFPFRSIIVFLAKICKRASSLLKMVEVCFYFLLFLVAFFVVHDLFQPSDMKPKNSHPKPNHGRSVQKVKQIGGKRDVDCEKAKCQHCISQKRGASTKNDKSERNSLK